MTGIRQSAILGMESSFASGTPTNGWFAPPPGFFCSYTADRSVTAVTAEGSKFVETYAYGAFSGSWDCQFYFDYQYIDIFRLAFESYSCQSNGDGTYTHTFGKANNSRVPSFCIRGKILNRMAGGPAQSDEMTTLKGCIVQSVKFSMSAGSSQVNVTMSGKFADIECDYGNLATTDYKEYNGELVEFSCMFIGTQMNDDTYVSMIDSLSVGVDNNADMLYTTCSAFGVDYYEGVSNFSFSASGYANDPERFKRRAFSGGQTNTPTQPMAKGLRPCADIYLASYNESVRDDGYDDIGEAITESNRSAVFHIEDCVYKTAVWQKGDGSKLQDQISSAECRRITLQVKTSVGNLSTTNAHPVTSAAPTN